MPSCKLEGSEFRLREDEFGQKRVVEADLTYLCDLAVFYPKNIFLMTDGFSLERETELSTSEKEFCTLSSPLKGGFSVNETVGVDLPEEGGYRLFQCVVEPEMHLCEEGEKATLEGDGRGADALEKTVPERRTPAGSVCLCASARKFPWREKGRQEFAAEPPAPDTVFRATDSLWILRWISAVIFSENSPAGP